MIKEEIMKKYNLDKSHSVWQSHIDNWHSIEAFKEQTGMLPNSDNAPDEMQTMMDFLDNKDLQMKLLKERGIEFGSMYLSAKRLLYMCLNKELK